VGQPPLQGGIIEGTNEGGEREGETAKTLPRVDVLRKKKGQKTKEITIIPRLKEGGEEK